MNLDWIQTFVKVAESGSFVQAARKLRMPTTTVSFHVAQLEKYLGVALIHRTTRKLHVTDAGMDYFMKCLKSLEELRMAEAELTNAAAIYQGKIKVTAPHDMAGSLIPKITAQFSKEYPQIEVEYLITNRVVDLVGEGVDLALRAGELEDSSLIGKKLIKHGFGFYSEKKISAKHPKDLSSENFLLHSEFRESKMRLKHGKEIYTLHPTGKICADDFYLLAHLAAEGLGIAVVPNILGNSILKLNPILPHWEIAEQATFSIVYPAQKYVAPRVRAFIETATQVIQDENFF
jgi:DNA-binding transcriptional LysR family regulator